MRYYLSYCFSGKVKIKKIEKLNTKKINENFENKSFILMVDIMLNQGKQKQKIPLKEQDKIEEILSFYNDEEKVLDFVQELCFIKTTNKENEEKIFEKEDLIEIKVEKITLYDLAEQDKPLLEFLPVKDEFFTQVLEFYNLDNVVSVKDLREFKKSKNKEDKIEETNNEENFEQETEEQAKEVEKNNETNFDEEHLEEDLD